MEIRNSQVKVAFLTMAVVLSIYLGCRQNDFDEPLSNTKDAITITTGFGQVLDFVLPDGSKKNDDKKKAKAKRTK